MTHQQRNAAILKRIGSYTAASTTSKRTARRALAKEGLNPDEDRAAPGVADAR